LINEQLLAARLGVDIEGSPDWGKLLEKCAKDAAYSGLFGEAWPRWWMFKILNKWNELAPSNSLQGMEAEDRVALLKKSFRLKNLAPAKPIGDGYSEKFWHVCKLFKSPISSRDAVQLSADRREWQDAAYSSLKAVLERKHIAEGYSLHAFERARIKALIDSFKNDKN
jgi:hypothetical protein